MSSRIALIVSDEASRRNYLQQLFRRTGMMAVSYPNPGRYVHDFEEREPQVLVVDLGLPVAPKLQIIDGALKRFPALKIITIGKRAVLEKDGVLRGRPNVVMCDRIEELAI